LAGTKSGGKQIILLRQCFLYRPKISKGKRLLRTSIDTSRFSPAEITNKKSLLPLEINRTCMWTGQKTHFTMDTFVFFKNDLAGFNLFSSSAGRTYKSTFLALTVEAQER
jgi:hypothetical protein